MSTSSVRRLLVAAFALVAFAAFASSASASTFEVSPGGEIASASAGNLEFISSAATIRCAVTMNGELEPGPNEEAPGTSLGEINNVEIGGCEGGAVERALFESGSWPVVVTRVLGTPPGAVTGLLFTIRGTKFMLSVFGGFIRCLYEGDAGALMTLTRTGTNVYATGRIRALAGTYRLIRGGFGCPRTGGMAGEFNITAQTITAI